MESWGKSRFEIISRFSKIKFQQTSFTFWFWVLSSLKTIGKDGFELYQMCSLHSGVFQSLRNVWRTLLCPAQFGWLAGIPGWHWLASQNPISWIPPCPSLHLLPLHVPDVLSTSLFRSGIIQALLKHLCFCASEEKGEIRKIKLGNPVDQSTQNFLP